MQMNFTFVGFGRCTVRLIGANQAGSKPAALNDNQ